VYYLYPPQSGPIVVILASLVFTPVTAYAASSAEPDVSAPKESVAITRYENSGNALTLESAVEEALLNNSRLAKTKARAKALAAVPSQAGALPDPMLKFGVVNLPTDTYDFEQEGMTQVKVGINQKIPFFGKRKFRRRAAQERAEAAGEQVDEESLKLTSRVKAVWWQLAYLDHALEIVRRNQSLLSKFVDIARTKYKVGQGLQQDVLLAQVEFSKLLDKEIQFKGKRKSASGKLNALLNRPFQQSVVLPIDTPTALPPPLSMAELQQLAHENRPLLSASRNQVRAASQQLNLAKRSYYPDLNVGLAYGRRQGINPNGTNRADFASLMLGINLPIYAGSKQSKAVEQQSANITQQQKALEAVQDKIEANIISNLSDYQRAREQAELFITGIIPQSRQTVSSMLAGYQVNKVDFLNLVRSQITLYNFETLYWKAVSDARQALAKLTATVGKEVTHE
jgi:outer membrane protein, heavy metal efflux system